MKNLSKEQRQKRLQEKLNEDPFLVDKELASLFGVSVQTIRLDRKELGIPEVRQRVKSVAREAYSKVKSVENKEIIGELINIELNKKAVSVLETTAELTLEEAKIVRGHHIFAQANSLAVAVIDTELALTGAVDIRYERPVKVGEKLIAHAIVTDKEKNKFQVQVTSKINEEIVFTGEFVVFAFTDEFAKEG